MFLPERGHGFPTVFSARCAVTAFGGDVLLASEGKTLYTVVSPDHRPRGAKPFPLWEVPGASEGKLKPFCSSELHFNLSILGPREGLSRGSPSAVLLESLMEEALGSVSTLPLKAESHALRKGHGTPRGRFSLCPPSTVTMTRQSPVYEI